MKITTKEKEVNDILKTFR